MDDILKSSEDVASAQIANKIMEDLTGKKNLQLNLDKSSFLVIGNKAFRRKVNSQLERSPLKLCNENMREERKNYLLSRGLIVI